MGWSTGSSAYLTFPLHSLVSSARREGSEYHFKNLSYDSAGARTHDLPVVRQTLYHWDITPVKYISIYKYIYIYTHIHTHVYTFTYKTLKYRTLEHCIKEFQLKESPYLPTLLGIATKGYRRIHRERKKKVEFSTEHSTMHLFAYKGS